MERGSISVLPQDKVLDSSALHLQFLQSESSPVHSPRSPLPLGQCRTRVTWIFLWLRGLGSDCLEARRQGWWELGISLPWHTQDRSLLCSSVVLKYTTAFRLHTLHCNHFFFFTGLSATKFCLRSGSCYSVYLLLISLASSTVLL